MSVSASNLAVIGAVLASIILFVLWLNAPDGNETADDMGGSTDDSMARTVEMQSSMDNWAAQIIPPNWQGTAPVMGDETLIDGVLDDDEDTEPTIVWSTLYLNITAEQYRQVADAADMEVDCTGEGLFASTVGPHSGKTPVEQCWAYPTEPPAAFDALLMFADYGSATMAQLTLTDRTSVDEGQSD